MIPLFISIHLSQINTHTISSYTISTISITIISFKSHISSSNTQINILICLLNRESTYPSQHTSITSYSLIQLTTILIHIFITHQTPPSTTYSNSQTNPTTHISSTHLPITHIESGDTHIESGHSHTVSGNRTLTSNSSSHPTHYHHRTHETLSTWNNHHYYHQSLHPYQSSLIHSLNHHNSTMQYHPTHYHQTHTHTQFYNNNPINPTTPSYQTSIHYKHSYYTITFFSYHQHFNN